MLLERKSNSPGIQLSGDNINKFDFDVFLSETDDESEFSDGFMDEKVEEIMRELYKEINCSSCTSVPPVATTLPSPASLPLFFGVAADVKSDSCGASMSDSASSVMAGIEFIGPTFMDKMELPEKLPPAGYGIEGMDGCDEVDQVGDEDQWLDLVLEWGPLEIDDWT